MDVVLKSEIILVALEREEGVTIEEFAGLFHQIHGYQLKLKNYGYKSLKDLLDDIKDDVELKNVNGQQLIKYRPPLQHSVISPCMDISDQNDDPCMLDTSSVCSSSLCVQSGDIALDEFPKVQPSSHQNTVGLRGHKTSDPALQSSSKCLYYLSSEAYFTMDTCFAVKQIPSNEIVQIICEKIKRHPTGLRPAKLRQYILEKQKIDLEIYSHILGYSDMLSMLKEIPTIKFFNTSGKDIIISSCFYSNLVKDHHKLSAKAELSKTGSSSTSSSTAIVQQPAQPDVSSNQKKDNKEPLLNEASPSQENDPPIPETCTESLHDPDTNTDDLPKIRVNHTEKSSPHEDSTPTLLVESHSSKQKSVNTTQKEELDIAKIISETIISHHHFGLKAKTLNKYMMSQYNIDLEVYSKQQGYTDMLSMLNEIPGIRFAEDSKTNLLLALGSHEKPQSSQTGQHKNPPLSWNKVADVLRMFPSGLRVEKLKQQILTIYHVDIEALSQEFGYTDMRSMLKEVPGITSFNGEVFFASNSHKPKGKTIKKVNFSENVMVEFLKSFSSGLTVKILKQHMKKKYNIDLIKYSQGKGFTDLVCWLQSIPGITVSNNNLVIPSHVNKTYNSKSKTKAAKCPKTAGTSPAKNPHVAMKTPHGNQTIPKPTTTRPNGTGQQTPLPICQIPLTNATNNIPLNAQQGLRPSVSYASACAGNQRGNQINVPSQQNPPIFNVQKAHTAKATHPNYNVVPKVTLPSSKIKDNLQLLLKSHANGLSIFRLKKLYLLKFQQPLVPKGSSARKLLMGMKDVAEIKGVGVQMKVIPVLSGDPPASPKTHRDSTPQGASAVEANNGRKNEVLTHVQVSRPLSVLKRAEHITHSVAVPPSSNQPSYLACNQTELNARYIPPSSSSNKKMVTTTILNQANSSGVLGSQFSKTYKTPSTAGIAGNLSEAQWPSLPQKFNILKEITQGAKMPEQVQQNIPNKELFFKQNPTVTIKPQEKDKTAQTSLQVHQDPYETNGKNDHKQKDQTPEMHENIPNNEPFIKQNPTVTSKSEGKDNVAQNASQVHQDPLKTKGKTDHKQKDQTPEKHENIPNNEPFIKQNPTVTSKSEGKDNMAQNVSQVHQDPLKTKGKTDHKQKDETSERHENISNNKLFFKQNPTVTSKPPIKVQIAKTLLQGEQDPFRTNSKNDHKQKDPTSDLVHPTSKSDFAFVMGHTGFSFVKVEASTNKDQKSTERGRNMHATPLQLNQSAYCHMAAATKGNVPNGTSANVLTQQKMVNYNSKDVTQQQQQQRNNDLVTSETVSSLYSMSSQKSTDSQPQQQTTSVCNKHVDPLEQKRQQALLQSQGTQPSCTGGKMASMPFQEKLEACTSVSICDFEQRGSTSSPPKQEVTESKCTKKDSNSNTIAKVGAQHIPAEKNQSAAQTTSINQPESSTVSCSQQNLPGSSNPPVNAKGSPISHKLDKDNHLSNANGQALKQEDGTDGTKAPLSPAQQKVSTDYVYRHEQTVTGPFQTHAKVLHPHASSPVEQSQSLTRTQHYYFNATAERPIGLRTSFTSKPYQHLQYSLHSGITSQPEFPNVPSNQENNSSEESTKTLQTESEHKCCIL